MSQDIDLLFSKYDLCRVMDSQEDKLFGEIDNIESNRLLNTSVEDLCVYLIDKYIINIPKIKDEEIQVDQSESKVDVSNDPTRFISDRASPFYITGTTITYFIPFEGDSELFHCRPSTFTLSPPRAKVNKNEILLIYTLTGHDDERVKKDFTHDIDLIKKYLEWISKDVTPFNQSLSSKARQKIQARREKLLKDQGLVANLGFPLRKRGDAPQTYTTPTVRRKIPNIPAASSKPYTPEPTLDMKEYVHILEVISNMVLVMEKSPKAFQNMKEEDLRQHFLVQLNGQYEGQGTAETFNFNGKTDILISENGKNIFIAECKFWRGPEEFIKAIDQLLGYTTWRDTKTALLIFNRERALSTILTKIPEIVKSHQNFKKQVDYDSETGFRFILKHRDDPNREIIMTVIIFEIPR